MADATAKLTNYRQAPRKVRLLADLVRGKSTTHALNLLANLPKRASGPMASLIRSAMANAKDIAPSDLYISTIQVNGGIVFRRSMPRARGRASAIKKRTSTITLALAKKAAPSKKTTRSKSEAKS